MYLLSSLFYFFFFNDTATTEIYTLSLHDALPICALQRPGGEVVHPARRPGRWRERHHDRGPGAEREPAPADRKSTRLNSSHGYISYAVFCLKKKKTIHTHSIQDRRTAGVSQS